MSKTNKTKDKKKKKKYFWRRFFVLLLLVLIVAGGVFAYRVNKLGGGLQGFLAATVGHDENTKKNLETFTFLALGKSQNLTDTIMVCSYNPKEQTASMLSIPRDTFVGNNKNKATASQKINALYQIKPEKTLEAVNKITGLNIKYYAMIDTASLRKVIDAIGGVYYDVPMDMKYDDKSQKLHINLKKGYQLLNGDKAEQLVRFRHGNNTAQTYPEEWGEQDLGRMHTQREFLIEAAKQTLQLKNIFKIGELIDIVHDNLETNIPIDLVKDYLPYAVEFSTENIKSDMLPGIPEKCNGVWIYTYDKKESEKLIEELFSNIATKSEDKANIKIEVLNGSGSKSALTKVTNLLKESGYNITTTSTTTNTSKTVIINRTNQSEEISNDLKNILELGNITTGEEDNKDIDFTIIIGKDYN